MKIKVPRWAIKFALSIADLESFSDTSKPDMRMYEYSWVIGKLAKMHAGTLLDIGCTASLNMVPATMCELGWKVYGLDIREFQFKHPNFTFVNEIPDIQFDVITAISSLEHFGMSGRYGIRKNNLSIARETVVKATEKLVKGGLFIVTVPYTFGTAHISNSMMIHDKQSIKSLMEPLDITDSVVTNNKEATIRICGIKQ